MESFKKTGRYQRIFDQLTELLKKSPDTISQMATIVAVLYHKFDYYFWCGFYRLSGEELIAGPYQGSVACQVLPAGKGVCQTAVLQKKTVIVDDVEKFPGHIACDSRSKSEIVVPVKDRNGNIIAVLDVDSKEYGSFDETDAEWLERILEKMVDNGNLKL